MDAPSRITGNAWTTPPFIRFEKNTEGFCITITLAAARIVDNVMHNTNFIGRINIVGKPMTIAKIANAPEAKNKYIAFVILPRNDALSGPASGSDPDSS